jgi:hypothetical protein
MNKYIRQQPAFSRNSDTNDDYWFDQIEKNLNNKEAVQSQPIDSFLSDQIKSIMTGKSRYPSVEAAVQDMKDRTGLTAFLNKQSDNNLNNNSIKTASDNNEVIEKQIPLTERIPMIIKNFPTVKSTIENVVRSTRGNLSLPAIIDRVQSIHRNDVADAKDWEDPNLLGYISRLNLKEKQNNTSVESNTNLGVREYAYDDDLDMKTSIFGENNK